MTLSALVLLAIPTFSGATAHAGSAGGAAASVGSIGRAAQAGLVCTEETVRWGGFQVLDAAIPSFDTGVDVVPQTGTSITVVGVSADGLDPTDHAHVMPVLVGDVPAVAGADVTAGGDVIVSTNGLEVLRAFGVTVQLRRCAEVAVAAQVPPVEVAGATANAPSTDATSTTSTTNATNTAAAPTAEEAAAVISMLPATGGDSWLQTLVGALLVAVGAALVTFGRRPRPVR